MWGKKEEEKIIITIKSHIAELEKLKKSLKCSMLNNILLLIHWHKGLNFTYSESTTGKAGAILAGVAISFSI